MNQNERLSLVKMMGDPSLIFDNERMVKKIEEVKKDKQGLLGAANQYNNKYENEIEEGTRRRQTLISDGNRRGLNEDESLEKYGKFLPSRRTPILNFLYFMFRDENLDQEFEQTRQKFNKEFGHLEESYVCESNDSIDAPPDLDEIIYGNLSSKEFQTIKKLKSLATDGSCNENESALAFTMCMKMCKKHGLEFERIPVNNKRI